MAQKESLFLFQGGSSLIQFCLTPGQGPGYRGQFPFGLFPLPEQAVTVPHVTGMINPQGQLLGLVELLHHPAVAAGRAGLTL